MQLNAFIDALNAAGISYETDAPLARRTTFRIGGPADVLICVRTVDELRRVVLAAGRYAVPCFLLGRGSNLLISDAGIEGAVIHLSGLDRVTIEDDRVVCGAGASLHTVCLMARDASLTGLEFACGIPGSVGGAVFMNAGAYGGEMAQVVESVRCLTPEGETVTLANSELAFGYRTSAVQGRGWTVVEAALRLRPGDRQTIAEAMEDYLSRRRQKQPLEYPSAGSAFKRPQGHYAGALIESSGLKGAAVGDAAISEKHAGFIINKGHATCRDVTELIEQVRQTVLKDSGVLLEPEIRVVGRSVERTGI